MGSDLDTAPGQDGAGTLAERLERRLSERLSVVLQRVGPKAERLRTRVTALAEAAARNWDELGARVRHELVVRKLLRDPAAESPPPRPTPDAQTALLNPLVRTAAPLLALMARLPALPPPANLEGLRHRIIAALRRFQSAARVAGVSADQMRAAHFTLCAAFDDIIAHTAWGRAVGWTERGLIQTFHKTIEPERGLTTLLDYMLTEPRRHICELELISLCMALGFEGRYRVQDDGPPAFRLAREQLYRAIAGVRGEPSSELSPDWRPAPPPRKPFTALVPPWVAVSLTGALFAAFYVLLTLSIGSHADRVFQKLAALLPDRPAAIAHYEPAGAAETTTATPGAGQVSTRAKRYQTALGSEAAAGMIEVVSDGDLDILRISGTNAFVRGGETLSRPGHQLVERLAVLLDREPGHLLVVGHTDDRPALSIRIPSALALSEARARAVARVLVAHLGEPERVDIEGRADTEPLAPNTSQANRDRNRRVEIVLPHGVDLPPPAGEGRRR